MNNGDYQQLIDEAFDAVVEEVQWEAEEAEREAVAAVPHPIHYRRTIRRDHAGANQRLMDDYFGDNPVIRQRFSVGVSECLNDSSSI